MKTTGRNTSNHFKRIKMRRFPKRHTWLRLLLLLNLPRSNVVGRIGIDRLHHLPLGDEIILCYYGRNIPEVGQGKQGMRVRSKM